MHNDCERERPNSKLGEAEEEDEDKDSDGAVEGTHTKKQQTTMLFL